MQYRRGIAAGLTALALAGGLAGCFNGYQAQTTSQGEGGEVASANVGDVQLRGVIWVRDPAAPQTAYLSGTMLVTNGGQPDELVSVTADPGGKVTLNSSPIPVTQLEPVRIGFNGSHTGSISGVPDAPSPFLTTTFEFAKAGKVSVPVLVVPGVGTYADVVAQSKGGGASASASGEASTTAEPSSSASPASSAASSAASASETPAPAAS